MVTLKIHYAAIKSNYPFKLGKKKILHLWFVVFGEAVGCKRVNGRKYHDSFVFLYIHI